ncbi:hypothetical protein NPIL_65021 [Nephila pilipes]|uniref:Uncharacterized protein n=1 Tax=Nephila pilipes TaxID=299642 RepID=A0A8X6Q403_NEPPI|nr:hypothetical protein NPIL_65021 [Nephila pilipes]
MTFCPSIVKKDLLVTLEATSMVYSQPEMKPDISAWLCPAAFHRPIAPLTNCRHLRSDLFNATSPSLRMTVCLPRVRRNKMDISS